MVPADTFQAAAAFEAASLHVADWPLCQVRLQNDGRFCWLILLPRVEGAVELSDLTADQRATLMEEAVEAGRLVAAMAQTECAAVDKINTAAIGNVTSQLHVHVVGRRRDDPLWPDPVWGRPGAIFCEPAVLESRIQTVKSYQLAV
ncbi:MULTISPECIES: HIT domain-containing protein [unclassified Brevundimonas]|uniref:HIT domain-containing protein n=1 Tax=unclassified Brevundimonas TaxID=2622653 RepID=UPI0025C3C6BD|nr:MULTISPECIES: HIT domain-containing protein [unclassified Brevundimonas]